MSATESSAGSIPPSADYQRGFNAGFQVGWQGAMQSVVNTTQQEPPNRSGLEDSSTQASKSDGTILTLEQLLSGDPAVLNALSEPLVLDAVSAVLVALGSRVIADYATRVASNIQQ